MKEQYQFYVCLLGCPRNFFHPIISKLDNNKNYQSHLFRNIKLEHLKFRKDSSSPRMTEQIQILQRRLGTDRYFFVGGRGEVGKSVLEKLFADAINTEINCMQLKKIVCRKTDTQKKIVCCRSRILKTCLHVEIFEVLCIFLSS